MRFIDETLKQLAIREDRVGQLARKALRMRHDGEKLSEEDDANMQRLLRAIGAGLDKDSTQRDPVSGEAIINFDIPEELREPDSLPTPDWVTETPEDVSYDLIVCESGGGTSQCVNLTREEFIALKRTLAIRRGHLPPTDHDPDIVCMHVKEWELLETAHKHLTTVMKA
jgi:hypothetical protein